MSIISAKYIEKICKPSDINEHLETLRTYALKVNHITECGVRSVVSSYAFADGLLNNPKNKLVQIDLETNENVKTFQKECALEGINNVFYQTSDLDCPLEETDLLFIDTWHVYGQMKRELERWHSYVKNFIILHDTTVDEWEGETIRMNMDAYTQCLQTKIPKNEILLGIWPAVEEFLQNNLEWKLKERFFHNNGLTVLEKN